MLHLVGDCALNQHKRDTLRPALRKVGHQRFRRRTELDRLSDGEAEGCRHAVRVGRPTWSCGDQAFHLGSVVSKARLRAPAIGRGMVKGQGQPA